MVSLQRMQPPGEANTFYNKLMIVEAALRTHPFDADVEFVWFATVNLLLVTDPDNSEWQFLKWKGSRKYRLEGKMHDIISESQSIILSPA